jgi:hypothetical protein
MSRQTINPKTRRTTKQSFFSVAPSTVLSICLTNGALNARRKKAPLLVKCDTLQYSGVGEDIWRRLSSSWAAWSLYRDNIEEEFTVKRVSGSPPDGKNPLDDLFNQK